MQKTFSPKKMFWYQYGARGRPFDEVRANDWHPTGKYRWYNGEFEVEIVFCYTWKTFFTKRYKYIWWSYWLGVNDFDYPDNIVSGDCYDK